MAGFMERVKSVFTGTRSYGDFGGGYGGISIYGSWNAYSRPQESYRRWSSEGYRFNPIVYRCVNIRADLASSIPFKIMKGDKDVTKTNEALMKLLTRPNPLQSGAEFFTELVNHLSISGNAYVLMNDALDFDPAIQRPSKSKVVGLQLLRPDMVTVKMAKNGYPEKYVYQYGEGNNERQEYTPLQVKHIKLFNPTCNKYGLSPLAAAGYSIDSINNIVIHNNSLSKNAGRVPGWFSVKTPVDKNGQMAKVSKEQTDRIRKDIEDNVEGPFNPGKNGILPDSIEYIENSKTPTDLDFKGTDELAAVRIALALGIPTQFIGIKDNQSWNNTQEANLWLIEKTITPLCKHIASDLTESLAKRFGVGLKICYDFDALDAVAEKKESKMNMCIDQICSLKKDGIINANEARAMLMEYEKYSKHALKDLEDGKVLKENQSVKLEQK